MAEHLQDPDESHCLKFFEAAVRFFRSTNFRSHQIMAEANIQRLPGPDLLLASFCVLLRPSRPSLSGAIGAWNDQSSRCLERQHGDSPLTRRQLVREEYGNMGGWILRGLQGWFIPSFPTSRTSLNRKM